MNIMLPVFQHFISMAGERVPLKDGIPETLVPWRLGCRSSGAVLDVSYGSL